MVTLLVGRLVSGLGVSSKAAALSLTRQASCDVPAPTALLCLSSSAWQRWPDSNYVLGCVFSTAAATSSTPSSSFTSSAAAALHEPATARAAGCPSQSFATIASAATDSTGKAASTNSFTRASSAASPAARSGSFVGTSTPDSSSATAAAGAGTGANAGVDMNPWSPLAERKPDLVEKLLSLDMCSSGQRRQAERQDVLRDFQRHPADTGSPPVMIAMWTHRVRSLVRVFDSARKQLPSIRQLEMLVNKRRRMLTWLRRTDFESYSYTISKLGLRDIYVPTGGANRYREGTRSSDPVDEQINRLRFNFHTKYRQGKTSMWYRLRPKLVTEDPALQSADAAAAVEDRQRRQQRREVAAQQRMAAEQEQRK
ncbi:hypothetical protein VaNZ11_005344 [Volvox africanus]|uniref:Small ribosomal subunit protein uS15c n=1 Tax=Volvox africanus TaxID=51714 RepID=A0ABQ5RYW7_9CHLO|nr:hypothetical protein VaNZ11_005344 [Volvox africanus]